MQNVIIYVLVQTLGELKSIEVGKIMYHPIPNNELWRIHLVEELLEIQSNISDIDDWSKNEISNLLESAPPKVNSYNNHYNNGHKNRMLGPRNIKISYFARNH